MCSSLSTNSAGEEVPRTRCYALSICFRKDRFRVSLLTFQIDCRVFPRETFSCPLHVLPLRRTYGWTALKAALALNRLAQREKVSIVHTFFETSDLWAAPIAKMERLQSSDFQPT